MVFFRWLCLGVLGAVVGCCPPSLQPPSGASTANRVTPLEARLQTLAGEAVTLESYRGQVLLVDFWATWCAPCRLAFPFYADIHARHAGEGFRVVAISIDEKGSDARDLARRWRFPFDVLHDADKEAARAFSVYQIPCSFLLDRQGRIRFVHRGFDASGAHRLEEEVWFLTSEERSDDAPVSVGDDVDHRRGSS